MISDASTIMATNTYIAKTKHVPMISDDMGRKANPAYLVERMLRDINPCIPKPTNKGHLFDCRI